ncbi:Transcriptional regulator, XRE family [Candidatus Burkholderia humilis]|nr:Transcriptional regulator, XRE family [Candidatus Burkholderia humilis]
MGPIQSMTWVAENAGAVVMPVSGLAAEIDASSFATRRPVIAVNPEGRSACRARFGVAHEIGRFCLHIGVQTGDKLTESQTNRFASAFLMPRRHFAPECRGALRNSRLNWPALSDMKMRWGVSKAAILYRGRQLGVFTEEQYKTGGVSLHRRGEARGEEEDARIPVESPDLIADSMEVLKNAFGISRVTLARQMNVHVALLDELLSARFGVQAPPASLANVARLPSARAL